MRKLSLALGLVLFSGMARSESNLAQLFPPTENGANISCASALHPADKFESDIRSWVLGFWSGQNFEGRALVGRNTDSNGIVGEVEKVCRSQPSMLFISAVRSTYMDMKKAGR